MSEPVFLSDSDWRPFAFPPRCVARSPLAVAVCSCGKRASFRYDQRRGWVMAEGDPLVFCAPGIGWTCGEATHTQVEWREHPAAPAIEQEET